MRFEKIWQSESEYKISQIRDDGITRWVDETYGQYVDWLAAGNEPVEIPYVAPVPGPEPEPERDLVAEMDVVQSILDEILFGGL